AEGEHAEDLIERAHLAELLQLIAEVFEREGVLAKLLGQRLGLGLIDRRLRLLDQREHVAHSEDARGQAVGMERLERVRLLADAHEGDGAARDVTDGARGAAARRAVPLGYAAR